MNSKDLFEKTLGIKLPLQIISVEFEESKLTKKKELYIVMDFKEGAKFKDKSDIECEVQDTQLIKWTSGDFFDFSSYVQCEVPRIKTSTGEVVLVDLPWSGEKSGFTQVE